LIRVALTRFLLPGICDVNDCVIEPQHIIGVVVFLNHSPDGVTDIAKGMTVDLAV